MFCEVCGFLTVYLANWMSVVVVVLGGANSQLFCLVKCLESSG